MLRSFAFSDFDQLNSWVTSEEVLWQFSGTTFTYPLQYADMQVYMSQYSERKFYMAHNQQSGDYGFGEIIPQPNNVPRLGRLLVGKPELRGKGLGKELILCLIAECKKMPALYSVELYVLIDNEPAIKCYQSIGFKFIGDVQPLIFNNMVKLMKKMRLDF